MAGEIRPSVSVIYCWKCTCLSHYSAGRCVISLILRSSFGVDTRDIRDSCSTEENAEIIEEPSVSLMTMIGVWELESRELTLCPVGNNTESALTYKQVLPSETCGFHAASPSKQGLQVLFEILYREIIHPVQRIISQGNYIMLTRHNHIFGGL